MALLVDTSVWSLAFRRDADSNAPQVVALVIPDRDDHIGAANLRNRCRRAGVKVGTIDALLAQLCIRHELQLLTTDRDFTLAARHCPLQVWKPGS